MSKASVRKGFRNALGKDALAVQDFYNYYNNESAVKQMKFQEKMSNTAHQREVADLRKAGLNPILSANAGAPSMPGAYSTIDETAGSASMQAKLQTKLTNMQLDAQKQMNKYSTDKSYELGLIQAKYGLLGTQYAANSSANASMYAARQAAGAAMYNAQLGFANAEAQRAWDALHPNNPWSMISSMLAESGMSEQFIDWLKGLVEGNDKSFFNNPIKPSNSSTQQKSSGNQKANRGRQ